MEHYDSIVVAVTGGMGCGQTTVCQYFEKMGAKCINADMIAKREIEINDEIQKELKRVFGSRIFYRNGKLNRKLLARIAFSDDTKTEQLNRIVHPQMVARIISTIEEARESGKYNIICVDAALIYEMSLEHMFDAVVVVSSKMPNRIERIKQREKISDQEIVDRISKQIPLEDKVKWADFVIRNDRDLETLEKNCRNVYQKLKNIARKKRQSAPKKEKAFTGS
ncbi:MAG: dephospho-CoA kinase [Calditrichaeota bacterium]|nr:dephospho-CoA kinase [Calditrichota bacterium]RQW02930.1 MAG: dephospho-CoA kinase [Calditrichota bacterium]